MPPQQGNGLLNLLDGLLNFGAHGISSGRLIWPLDGGL
jgi:hypothetical protein